MKWEGTTSTTHQLQAILAVEAALVGAPFAAPQVRFYFCALGAKK
jgi:hypothetical protein